MITNPGQRLGERYVLQERLAVGGMGEVWSAVDEVLNRPVAVKVLRTDLAPDTAFQARFRAEARTAAALSHGGIAAVYDYGEMLGSAYLVMELVPGVPLSAMISQEGALGTDRTLQIVSQAARALHAAHRHGVIHRDIKPANLMVTPELRVKVTDFGIARPRDHEPLTATGQVMGTAHYLAPELARGEIASPLSDVYALGVVAYECLAGWRPFDGDNQVAVATAHLQDEPPPLPATIPPQIRKIVMAAMAKNPAERPQGANTLAALMEDVRLRGLGGGIPQVVEDEPIQAWPADAVTPPRGVAQPSNRHAAVPGRLPDNRQIDNRPPDNRPPDNRQDITSGIGRQTGNSLYPPARAEVYPGAGRTEPPGYGRTEPSGDSHRADQDAVGRAPHSAYGPGSGYPAANRTPAPEPGFPGPGQSEFGADSFSRKPRANHSRSPRSTGPATSPMVATRRSGSGGRFSGRPTRRMSTPLAALIILVIVVALGGLWAKHRDAGKPHSLGVRHSVVVSQAPLGHLSTPQVRETG